MDTYLIKEIFYTLQGEGAQSGSPAIFCRFSKCNLWSGRKEDRHKAICKFCDTDFVGTNGQNGGTYSDLELVTLARSLCPTRLDKPMLVVFTGGEPGLQLKTSLVQIFKDSGFRTAIESNGTIELPKNLDWITISPKANTTLKQRNGNELKIVYPQNLNPNDYINLNFEHFYISPMTSENEETTKTNIEKSIKFCLNNPNWKLSFQSHKIWNID